MNSGQSEFSRVVTWQLKTAHTHFMGSANHKPKAPPTTDPRGVLFYGLPVGSGFTLRVMLWCCRGGLNSL